ncbi:helix-turn-helix transcriptional regulator [Microbacterium oleivorans]|uniref:helix-turn-helix transcriptional regulator n=1 Tax=Microbacterium oleivorans TaxID=273677 RepID=UPI00203FB63F|nr:helix-turn-helix domain-containing protein [Microbacterium oleivorans]MCM3696325.1 helix-turn-helix domain-containing protein [Microbacterium oleivorans]
MDVITLTLSPREMDVVSAPPVGDHPSDDAHTRLTETAHVECMTTTDATPTPILYSTKELAVLLGISARSLEDWRLRNYGPRYVRLGKHVLYQHRDVIAFLDACTIETEAPRG